MNLESPCISKAQIVFQQASMQTIIYVTILRSHAAMENDKHILPFSQSNDSFQLQHAKEY